MCLFFRPSDEIHPDILGLRFEPGCLKRRIWLGKPIREGEGVGGSEHLTKGTIGNKGVGSSRPVEHAALGRCSWRLAHRCPQNSEIFSRTLRNWKELLATLLGMP